MKNYGKKKGVTIVELLVSTMVFIIVALGWVKIMNATSPYREAQRRAAVEIAAGVLDIFYPAPTNSASLLELGYYRLADDLDDYPFVHCGNQRQKFPRCYLQVESPVRYRIEYYCGYADDEWLFDDDIDRDYLEQDHYRKAKWQAQWQTIRDNWPGGTGDCPGYMFIVRIELYGGESETEYEKPFAKFEQVVGIGDMVDLGGSWAPKLQGFTE